MSKIKKVTVKDVRRIEGEQIIEPESDVIVITGPNGHGKTSFITALTSVFEGGKSLPPEPINRNSKDGKGRIEVELDNGLILTRKITKSGTQLEIIDEQGLSIKKAQEYVDSRMRLFAINPLEFAESDPAAQAKMAKRVMAMVVGSDMGPIAEYLNRYKVHTMAPHSSVVDMIDVLIANDKGIVYLQRRDLKRHVETLEGALPAPKASATLVDVEALEARAGELDRSKKEHQAKGKKYHEAHTALGLALNSIRSAHGYLSDASGILETEHAEVIGPILAMLISDSALKIRNLFEPCVSSKQAADFEVDKIEEQEKAIAEDIGAARANAENEKRTAETRSKLDDARERLATAEADLKHLRELRDSIIANAKSPVEGLAVENDQVTISGMPFEQCSQAERLTASTKLAMALSPDLRVMRITDGNSLDRAAFAMLCQLVAEQDFQLWIERVADDDNGVGFFFLDGKIAGTPSQTSKT